FNSKKTSEATFQEQAQIIAGDILTGLTWLHENQIFHSDMKPANVLLKEEDGKIRAKIGDFGFARDLAQQDQRVYINGDRGYSSPELRAKDSKLIAKRNSDPDYPDYLKKVEAFFKANDELKAMDKELGEKMMKLEELQNGGDPHEKEAAEQEVNNAKVI